MSDLELIKELRQTIKDERYARQCDHKMVAIKIAELEEKVNRLELSIEDYEGYRGVDEDRIKSLEDVLEPLIECSLLNAGHHTAARTARKVLLTKSKEGEDV